MFRISTRGRSWPTNPLMTRTRPRMNSCTGRRPHQLFRRNPTRPHRRRAHLHHRCRLPDRRRRTMAARLNSFGPPPLRPYPPNLTNGVPTATLVFAAATAETIVPGEVVGRTGAEIATAGVVRVPFLARHLGVAATGGPRANDAGRVLRETTARIAEVAETETGTVAGTGMGATGAGATEEGS